MMELSRARQVPLEWEAMVSMAAFQQGRPFNGPKKH